MTLSGFPIKLDERVPRGMVFAGFTPSNDDGEREAVVIQNLSFDPQGRVYKLTQGRLRRWWRTKRGWTHYVGEHRSEWPRAKRAN